LKHARVIFYNHIQSDCCVCSTIYDFQAMPLMNGQNSSLYWQRNCELHNPQVFDRSLLSVCYAKHLGTWSCEGKHVWYDATGRTRWSFSVAFYNFVFPKV
jgi:hypothetical protein